MHIAGGCHVKWLSRIFNYSMKFAKTTNSSNKSKIWISYKMTVIFNETNDDDDVSLTVTTTTIRLNTWNITLWTFILFHFYCKCSFKCNKIVYLNRYNIKMVETEENKFICHHSSFNLSLWCSSSIYPLLLGIYLYFYNTIAEK